MKAKKELFLNYLKDTDEIKINKSKSLIQNGLPKVTNNNNINKINKSFTKDKINNKNYSFENFVFQIKNYDYNEITKWDNPARKYAIDMDKNKNKIKLTELVQINYANPLLLLNKEYTQEEYNVSLFISELNSIEDIIKINKNKTNKKKNKKDYNDIIANKNIYIEKIMEKREKLEINKKILNYYLQYYCNNNFDVMSPSISKIRELTKIVDLYYDRIHAKKKKSLILKKYIFDNSMKIYAKKKKFENLTKLYFILKNNILTCYKDIKKLKLKSMNYNFIKYYEENNRLLNEIELIEKDILKIFNIGDNTQNNIIKFNVISDIKNKLIRKKEKFNKIYNIEKSNIFDSKKSYIYHLYYLFNIEHNTENKNDNNNNKSDSGLFVTEMVKIFKLKSKTLILETVQDFKNKQNQNKNSIIIFNLDKPKLSKINNVIIDETNLIPCFIIIYTKIKNLVDIYLYYYNLICGTNNIGSNNDENFKNEFKSRKNEFYEILDKHLSKLIILLDNIINKGDEEPGISKQNLLIIINLICLFEKLLKIKFGVKYNKYINITLKNFLINKIKLENKKIIDNSIILLLKDIWDKNTLDPSIFDIELMQIKIPFNLKKFISFFNESEIKESLTSKLINKDNIDDIFNYISNYYDNYTTINNDNPNDNNNNYVENIKNINFDEVLNIYSKEEIDKLKNEIQNENENNTLIFNKPLKYTSLYITNSSCCILKGIEEQIINIIIFDSLIYEIFYELFDSIDLYIFITFKMFLKDNNHLSKLLKNLNLKEIQKDMGNLEYWSDIVSYQKKYIELKKFYIVTEVKFCEFFGKDKQFISDEEKQLFIDNIIPKINLNNNIPNEKQEKEKQRMPDNNKNFNIFSFKKNNASIDKKENKDINNGDNKNDKKENDNNKKEEDEDGIEPLNINQINESNINNSSDSNTKTKSEGFGFFNFFRSSNENTKSFQDVPIEELIKEVKTKLSTIHIKEIIIFISCLLTLKKILKRLVLFTTKIELELQRYEVLNKINKYEKIIEQIRNYFYMDISSDILDFSKISYLIVNFKWSPSPEEGSTQLFEASEWVKKIKNLFEVIVCEIHNRFNELFGEKKLTQFLIILIKYIIENIQESFSKIKKCNDMGRSIMLKDIKQLKEGIENTLKKYNYYKNIKTNILFDILIQYANAWYYNKDELTNYISNYNIQYKYFESFLNTSPIINELSYENKSDLINKVKQNYLNQFKKIISKFKEDN